MGRDLLQNLVWPAAAGNVAWALMTLVIEKGIFTEGILARVMALTLISLYLVADWKDSYHLTEADTSLWDDYADFVHIVSIVVFAIAVELPWSQQALAWSLGAVFFWTIVGNLSGVWEEQGPPDWMGRSLMAGCNLLGIATLYVGGLVFPSPSLWSLAFAITLVLATRESVEKRYYA